MSKQKGMVHYRAEVKQDAESAVRAAQYRAIYHHKEEYAMKVTCTFFGVSLAAYYDPSPAKTWSSNQSQGCFAADAQAVPSFALKIQSNSLMNKFTFTTMNGYN